MPQMAPYNWMNLFILTSLTLLYSSTYIYFINYTPTLKSNTLKKSSFLWTWKF